MQILDEVTQIYSKSQSTVFLPPSESEELLSLSMSEVYPKISQMTKIIEAHFIVSSVLCPRPPDMEWEIS